MKRTLLLGLAGLVAHTLLAQDSGLKDKVLSATKQLGGKANYSWTLSTKEGDGSPGRLGPIEGKADQAGLVYLTFTVSGVGVEVYLNGQKGTAKAMEGWQTLDEIAQTSGTAASVVRFLRSYKAPAGESASLAAMLKDVKEAGGVCSGDLKEEAARELLLRAARRREGQEAPKVTDPKGSVKFWVQDGALSKYEVNLQGKITTSERELDINRTTTVEIKDAGATKLAVPAEAKQKLG